MQYFLFSVLNSRTKPRYDFFITAKEMIDSSLQSHQILRLEMQQKFSRDSEVYKWYIAEVVVFTATSSSKVLITSMWMGQTFVGRK